jgi:hypothetical protein
MKKGIERQALPISSDYINFSETTIKELGTEAIHSY